MKWGILILVTFFVITLTLGAYGHLAVTATMFVSTIGHGGDSYLYLSSYQLFRSIDFFVKTILKPIKLLQRTMKHYVSQLAFLCNQLVPKRSG